MVFFRRALQGGSAPSGALPAARRSGRALSSAARWRLAFVALFAALAAPLFVVDVPPILDYPNHLARLFFMAHPDDPFLSRFYAVRWGVIPDIAIDAVVPWLMRICDVHVAGKLMLAGVLLLTMGSVAAYSRAVFGRRLAWPLASALVAYNAAFLLGFLNFVVAVDLGMLFAAGWIAFRDRRPAWTIALASLATVALFFAHLTGLAFFLVLVGSSEAEIAFAAWRRGAGLFRTSAVRIAWALPLLVGPLALYKFTGFSDATGDFNWTLWDVKAWQVVAGFINYDLPLDLATAAAVVGLIVACLALRRGRIAPKAALALGFLGVLYAALPFSLKGTHWLDLRPAIMVGLLMFAAFTPERIPARVFAVAAFALVAIFALRMGEVTRVWTAHQADLDQLRSVIADVPPGARVFVVDIPTKEAPDYWAAAPPGRLLSVNRRLDFHMVALLAIERRAFWAGLFADPAQQPVVRRQPYDDLAHLYWKMPTHAQLAADHIAPGGPGKSLFERFVCTADYVLVTEAGADPDPQKFGAGWLDLLRATDMAALYKVRPAEGAATLCPIAAAAGPAPG